MKSLCLTNIVVLISSTKQLIPISKYKCESVACCDFFGSLFYLDSLEILGKNQHGLSESKSVYLTLFYI